MDRTLPVAANTPSIRTFSLVLPAELRPLIVVYQSDSGLEFVELRVLFGILHAL